MDMGLAIGLILVAAILFGAVGFFVARMIEQAKSANLAEKVAELTKRQQEMEADAVKKTEAVAATNLENVRIQAEVDRLTGTVGERDATIAELKSQASDLMAEVESFRDECNRLDHKRVELESQVESVRQLLQERESNHQARLQDLLHAKQEMEDRFKTLSTEVLSSSQETLVKSAKDLLEQLKQSAELDQEQREVKVSGLIKPIQDQLKSLEELNRAMDDKRNQEVGTLGEQIRNLMDFTTNNIKETSLLRKALDNPGQSGSWGEMMLDTVLKNSGLQEGINYTRQTTVESGDQRGRPDVTIKMPGDKVIFIDSKAPMSYVQMFADASMDEDPAARERAFLVFATKLEEHVKALSKRKYSDLDASLDITVLFLPNEAAYRMAMELKPGLYEDAFQQKIVIATPSTLFALLRAIHYGWRQESLAKEAIEIRRRGSEIYRALSTLAEHFNRMGRSLDQACDAYNKFGASLESRTLPSARRLKELGVHDGDDIGDVKTVEGPTHTLTKIQPAGELPAPRARKPKASDPQLALVDDFEEVELEPVD